MRVFEHRKYIRDRSLPFGGMTDQVVAVFHGEENRARAYFTCPLHHVVWEYDVTD